MVAKCSILQEHEQIKRVKKQERISSERKSYIVAIHNTRNKNAAERNEGREKRENESRGHVCSEARNL